MASYPTSVKTFTSKNAGDTIQQSHINDVQDEVNAIEDGLLNGLNHAVTISTGGLTVSTGNTVLGQNLSVAGPSTVHALTVSSNLSVGGSFTPPRADGCRLTLAANLPIAASTPVGVNWTAQTFATAGMHSTTTNSSRINLNSSGLWEIRAQCEFVGNASISHHMRLSLNDSTTYLAGHVSAAQNIDPFVFGCGAFHLATSTGDYVTVQVQSKDSTGTIVSTNGWGGTFVEAVKISG